MYRMKNAAFAEYHSIGKGQSAGPLKISSLNPQKVVKNIFVIFESVLKVCTASLEILLSHGSMCFLCKDFNLQSIN